MAQKSQSVTFELASSEPRAWVVVKSDHHSPLVMKMQKVAPNQWSANFSLTSGEYRCRFYCGDERNVVYFGPANISGSTESGMDAVVMVKSPQEEILPKAANILLVEDDNDSLNVYAKILRTSGHIVHTADGYQAALDVAHQERVDLVVCDIGLWDGDGCDLLKELQKLRPVKAIAVTGRSLADEAEDYRAAGFSAVLPKPIQNFELESAISRLSLS
jgi:two-component system OmpR family response regulator